MEVHAVAPNADRCHKIQDVHVDRHAHDGVGDNIDDNHVQGPNNVVHRQVGNCAERCRVGKMVMMSVHCPQLANIVAEVVPKPAVEIYNDQDHQHGVKAVAPSQRSVTVVLECAVRDECEMDRGRECDRGVCHKNPEEDFTKHSGGKRVLWIRLASPLVVGRVGVEVGEPWDQQQSESQVGENNVAPPYHEPAQDPRIGESTGLDGVCNCADRLHHGCRKVVATWWTGLVVFAMTTMAVMWGWCGLLWSPATSLPPFPSELPGMQSAMPDRTECIQLERERRKDGRNRKGRVQRAE
mmetsp:Transcript_96844/g.202353  ORF Transcript_96844/g.202353 Transcript_96844/m.202353 type:complete len:296 (+) Transcript_96844:621-1508(+)